MPEKSQPTDLDEHISCTLCKGLLIDAVTLTECAHSFCRSCLLRHLIKNYRCPKCNNDLGASINTAVHTDSQLQTMVYKLAPQHYWQELKQRIEFMNKTKLSDDDLKTIANRKLAQLVAQLCAADENVSIVLEYASTGDLIMTNIKKEEEDENEPKPSTSKENTNPSKSGLPTSFKRYFRCPALTKICHLKKILELKLDLADNYAVYFIDPTKQEVLDDEFTMQDLAYLYTWDRRFPMKLIFILTKILCEEDKPPELDVQEMPELCPEAPVENLNNLTSGIALCEPQIPSLTVSLSTNLFDNCVTSGENGPMHHPPIITTTVPPPPKKKRKMGAPVKRNSTGTSELNSSNNPPSSENSLLESPLLNSPSAEPANQPQLVPQTQPLIASKMPHLLPIRPKPENYSDLPPLPTSSSLGLVPTNGLTLPPTPTVNVPTSVEQANQNIFATFFNNFNQQFQQPQASSLSAAMPQLFNACMKNEDYGKRFAQILPATSQNTFLAAKNDGSKPNFFINPGSLTGPKSMHFPFLQPMPVDKAILNSPNQLRLPIISATEAANLNYSSDKNFTTMPLLNTTKPAVAN